MQQLCLLKLAQRLQLLLFVLFRHAQQILAQLIAIGIGRRRLIEGIGIQQFIQQQRMARQLTGNHRRGGAEANQMFQRAGKLAEQFQIGGSGDDTGQQRRNPRQRHRRIGPRAHLAEQMRHQLIQHLAPARADSAFIQLFTKIGNQRQHTATVVIRKMGQRRAGVILFQRILPQLAPVLLQLLIR